MSMMQWLSLVLKISYISIVKGSHIVPVDSRLVQTCISPLVVKTDFHFPTLIFPTLIFPDTNAIVCASWISTMGQLEYVLPLFVFSPFHWIFHVVSKRSHLHQDDTLLDFILNVLTYLTGINHELTFISIRMK